MDSLTSLPFEGLGLGGLVALFLVMLFTGRIVVKYVYDDMQRQRDYWQEKYHEGEQVRKELEGQIGTLIDAVSQAAANDELGISLLRTIRDAVTSAEHANTGKGAGA